MENNKIWELNLLLVEFGPIDVNNCGFSSANFLKNGGPVPSRYHLSIILFGILQFAVECDGAPQFVQTVLVEVAIDFFWSDWLLKLIE